jgi:hypothetical protein
MAYQILNYLGEELIPSVSEEQVAEMNESIEFNVFQWGEGLIGEFKRQLESGEVSDLNNTRIYKKIEE